MNAFAPGKIVHHPERLADWMASGDCWPVTVELDMTNACTDKCPCCAGGRERKTASMEPATATRVLDELSQVGVKAVIFTGGGEPLCHNRTPDMMQYAKGVGLDVGLITNGVLLDAKRMSGALNACTWVRVSLDAANAETYRVTHGTENFDKVCRNIAELADCIVGDTDIGVGYLVDARTAGGMEAAAALCAGLGVDYLQFRPFHHAANDTGLGERALAGFRAAQEHATPEFKVVWSTAKFNAMLDGSVWRSYGKCYGHCMATVIGADGNVYVCCHMRGIEKYVLGNVNEDSFSNIWASERRQSAIAAIDLASCPNLCRCDSFNRLLWDMRHKPPKHVNFL